MEAYDADELVSYRSLSSLAIVALVLGLISPLVLLSPLFMVIPLAGIAASLLAIYKIRTQSEVLTGVTLAKIGLFLCVFCLIVAPTKTTVRSRLYEQQADQAARQWLNTLAEGDLSEALKQITPDALRGLTPPRNSGGPPTSRTPTQPSDQDALNSMAKDDLVEKLRTQTNDGPLTMESRVTELDRLRSQPTIRLEYEVNTGDDTFSVEIICVRLSRLNRGDIWQVGGWKLIDSHAH